MKVCNRCNQSKEIEKFGKKSNYKDGLNITCKQCMNEAAKIYGVKNKEIIYERKKLYYQENKDKIRELRGSEKYKKKRNETRRNNSDKLYRIKNSIRTSIGRSIKMKGFIKTKKTQDILGIDFDNFYSYLELKFESWMTWDNYGKYNGEFNYGWDIDHIIPLISVKNEDDTIQLNHYTNLQPLCSKINRDIKKDNLVNN
jgi:hypothetical protein